MKKKLLSFQFFSRFIFSIFFEDGLCGVYPEQPNFSGNFFLTELAWKKIRSKKILLFSVKKLGFAKFEIKKQVARKKMPYSTQDDTLKQNVFLEILKTNFWKQKQKPFLTENKFWKNSARYFRS